MATFIYTELEIMDMSAITYMGLFTSFRKGMRNGNWKRLNRLEKALYRAALWYAKLGETFGTRRKDKRDERNEDI